MSFDTEVSLSLTVPRSELRSVRSDIEGSLGDMSLGVSAGGGGGGASGTGGQSRNRRMFRWARSRTQDLDTTVSLLERIDDTLEEGGGLGGGGGGLLGGLGTSVLNFGAGGIGVGIGSRIASALSSASLSLTASSLSVAAGSVFLAKAFGTERNGEDPVERGVFSFGVRPDTIERIFEQSLSFIQEGGGNRPAQRQRGAELLRRQQQQQLAQPEWMRQLLSGQIDAPRWVQEARQGVLFDTPSGQRAPDEPGGAQRERINFETTVEAQFDMSPEELERRIDGKLQELEREVARATGRGLGGTPIP